MYLTDQPSVTGGGTRPSTIASTPLNICGAEIHISLVDEQNDGHIAQWLNIHIGFESLVCAVVEDVSLFHKPAHAVALHRSEEHIHAFEGQQLFPIVISGVIHCHRIMRQILGSRNDISGAHFKHAMRLSLRDRKAKESTVALRESIRAGDVRVSVGVRHLQRVERDGFKYSLEQYRHQCQGFVVVSEDRIRQQL